jgi:hypothetical protein
MRLKGKYAMESEWFWVYIHMFDLLGEVGERTDEAINRDIMYLLFSIECESNV